MRKLAICLIFAMAALTPTLAQAYIGPGAGLSLLGAFWALVAAVGTMLLFIIAWPVRRMLRRSSRNRAARDQAHHDAAHAPNRKA